MPKINKKKKQNRRLKKNHRKKSGFFACFFGFRFWNRILWQMIAHDETLITKKFYIEHAIGFRNIERQRGHQLLKKYDTNNAL